MTTSAPVLGTTSAPTAGDWGVLEVQALQPDQASLQRFLLTKKKGIHFSLLLFMLLYKTIWCQNYSLADEI